MKRVIIAGGRDFNNVPLLHYHCDQLYEFGDPEQRRTWTHVVCGMAQGADHLGHNWAVTHGLLVIEYPANWNRFGRSAGAIRNEEMAKNAEALVAFWDGKSRGTKDMILRAVAHALEIHVIRY